MSLLMDLFRNLFRTFFKYILFFSILIPTITFAANNSPLLLTSSQYSLGLDLGVANPTQLGNAPIFPLGYSTYSYSPNDNNVFAAMYGVSISKILTIDSLYTLQLGVSFHHVSSMDVKGDLAQGISPPYYQSNYSYNINSSQYLVDAKLSRQLYNRFFPYFYLGLGVATNKAYNYSTDVPDYLTLTPEYSNKTTNSFSYSIGVGVDYLVRSNLSIGCGYRFINLGKVGLGSGTIGNKNAGAKLTQSNLYMNTVLAQLNYFIG